MVRTRLKVYIYYYLFTLHLNLLSHSMYTSIHKNPHTVKSRYHPFRVRFELLNKLLNVFSRITYVSPNSPMNINNALSRRGAKLGVAAGDVLDISVRIDLTTHPSFVDI